MSITKLLTLNDLVKVEIEKTGIKSLNDLRAERIKKITEEYNQKIKKNHFSQEEIISFNIMNSFDLIKSKPIQTPINIQNKLLFKISTNSKDFIKLSKVVISQFLKFYSIKLNKTDQKELERLFNEELFNLGINFIGLFISNILGSEDKINDFIQNFPSNTEINKLNQFWNELTEKILYNLECLLFDNHKIDINELDTSSDLEKIEKFESQVQETLKLILSRQPAKSFIKYYNERLISIIQHFKISDNTLVKLYEIGFKITPQLKEYLKINKIDDDFIAKWNLTLEDKNSVSLVVVLENIASGLFWEVITIHEDLFHYLNDDWNKVLLTRKTLDKLKPFIENDSIPSDDLGLIEDINSYNIINYGFSFLSIKSKNLPDILNSYFPSLPEQFKIIGHHLNSLFYLFTKSSQINSTKTFVIY